MRVLKRILGKYPIESLPADTGQYDNDADKSPE
jgi:hypothetical protein